MNGFTHPATANRLSPWSRPLRSLLTRVAGVVACGGLLLLTSCGRSAQTVAPDVKADAVAGLNPPAQPTAGQPAAQFAFSTSSLTLVKQTSATNGWVTVLSAPIKTPASKEIYVSASLEAGLFTQT